jgi:hypothetical protein
MCWHRRLQNDADILVAQNCVRQPSVGVDTVGTVTHARTKIDRRVQTASNLAIPPTISSLSRDSVADPPLHHPPFEIVGSSHRYQKHGIATLALPPHVATPSPTEPSAMPIGSLRTPPHTSTGLCSSMSWRGSPITRRTEVPHTHFAPNSPIIYLIKWLGKNIFGGFLYSVGVILYLLSSLLDQYSMDSDDTMMMHQRSKLDEADAAWCLCTLLFL